MPQRKYKSVEEWFEEDQLQQKEALEAILRLFPGEFPEDSKQVHRLKHILKSYAYRVMRETKLEITTSFNVALADLNLDSIGVPEDVLQNEKNKTVDDFDNTFYCQRDIEGEIMCYNQCDHCRGYYSTLEQQTTR